MIEKIRAIYNRALLRPMIYMATNRFLIALILLLLANLLLSGAHIKMYAALLLGVLFALCPAGVAGYWAVHWLRKGFGKLRETIPAAIEKRVEAKKEKNYVRTGI